MTVRVFACPNCAHDLRLGASICGKCYHPAPMINRYSTQLGVVTVVAALVSAGVLLLLRD